MSIYDITGIVKTTFNIAVTPRNISSGLIHTGLWPVNTDLFQNSDYLPSQITDRPPSVRVHPAPTKRKIQEVKNPRHGPTSSTSDERPFTTPSTSILNFRADLRRYLLKSATKQKSYPSLQKTLIKIHLIWRYLK
ncbi:jg2796 [Pararge aegeria aegeria]|uniref:Jg2796 protein n=1 Tax=Pararge aegeria aegeria TaxID=348720 RepID=A0A8S4QZ51_9NEOP|nr:jg2796 [Pararge aegeria aegeria]